MTRNEIEAVISREIGKLGSDKRRTEPNAALANLLFTDREAIAKVCVAALFAAEIEAKTIIDAFAAMELKNGANYSL